MADSDGSSTHTPWAVTPEKLEEAVHRIVEAAHPVKIILFGSRARGEARPDSDVDLMVVKEHPEDRSAEAARLYRCLRGLLMGVEMVVVGREEFEYWKDTPGNVYYEADQDGRTLYEAA